MQNSYLKTSAWWSRGSHCVENDENGISVTKVSKYGKSENSRALNARCTFQPLMSFWYKLFEKLVLNIKIFYCNLQVEVAHVVTIVGRFLSKLWLPSFCLVISWNLNHICVQFVDFFALQNIFNIQVKVASLRSATLIILARIALAWRLIVVLTYYTPTSILWKLNSFRLAIISLKSLKC